jgi:membrane associated rhomboid family serine protease
MATRRFGFRTPTPVVLVTLVVVLVMYLLTGLAAQFVDGGALYGLLRLTPGAVLDGEVWRLVTYGLLHDLSNPLHLVFNGITLFFFGRDLELRFGTLKFLTFLLVSVVLGGVFVVGASLLGLGLGAPVVGMSAACQASIVAWALFNRSADVRWMFAVPMKGIHMLVLSLLWWLLDAVSVSPTSASAHLGGIVCGFVTWALVARRNRIRLFWDDLLVKPRIRRGPRLTVVPKKDNWVN